MSDRRDKRLVGQGEPSQKTQKKLEIPIPKRGEFFGNLGKVAKTDSVTKDRPKQ